MANLYLKTVAETEKCFFDESINDKKEYLSGSALLGERYVFQLCYQADGFGFGCSKIDGKLLVEGPAKDWVKLQLVENVPVLLPIHDSDDDGNYLRTTPGLYPDVLRPYDPSTVLSPTKGLKSVWVDVYVPADAKGGEYPITLKLIDFYENEKEYGSVTFNLEVIPALLPKQETTVTEWFHTDCLASYYNVEVYSERHWEIIGNFMETAVKNGINMILTPLFTPALDTAPGAERPTVQLVDIERKDGKWSFNLDKLERWVKLGLSKGVEYFEIGHLFTQWGAQHAPKVMATTENGYERVFGWETDAAAPEYTAFLKQLIPEVLDKLKELGVDKNVVFHISDEPGEQHLEGYLKAKNTIKECLEGQVIMDALSDITFWEKGVVERPVVSIDHIHTYIERKVPNLWGYYCCCQTNKVSNRLLAMSTARNRIIGQQLYKYDIVGFLQWGYNFYYAQGSLGVINPYTCTEGNMWVPAGDTFSVYPSHDGKALESVHLEGFTQALTDIRAFKLAEKLTSKETVLSIIEEQGEVTFTEYPRNDEQILTVREKVNKLIKDNL